jgi:hypothetical protein
MVSDSAQTRPPRSVNTGELLSAVCAFALLLTMFLVEWYGVDRIPSRASETSGTIGAENAWHSLSLVRWVMLLTILVALGAVAPHARRRSDRAKGTTRLAVTVLGVVTSVLLVYRVLIVLPSAGEIVDQKLGALIGLVAAIGIALGGYESIRQDRASTNPPTSESPARVVSDRSAR